MKLIILFITHSIFSVTALTLNAEEKISIREFACGEFSKEEWMDKTLTLSKKNGVRLLATHQCGDVCPQYTVRNIFYKIPLGECDSVDGVIHPLPFVSVGGTHYRDHCVPKESICN